MRWSELSSEKKVGILGGVILSAVAIYKAWDYYLDTRELTEEENELLDILLDLRKKNFSLWKQVSFYSKILNGLENNQGASGCKIHKKVIEKRKTNLKNTIEGMIKLKSCVN